MGKEKSWTLKTKDTTHTQQKKASLLKPPMQSPAENSNSPSNQGKHNSTQTQSRRCCRGLKDCMIMGSIFSTNQPHQRHHHQPISNLVQQVMWSTTCNKSILLLLLLLKKANVSVGVTLKLIEALFYYNLNLYKENLLYVSIEKQSTHPKVR